jgi:putative membrane protein
MAACAMICWSDWHREPLLAYGLVLLGWLYAMVAGPLRGLLAPGAPFCRREAARFYAGLGILFLAVCSPLDQIGGVFLFTAGMVQQLLILYPAAALLLLGLPGWMADAVLDRPVPRSMLRRLLNPFAGSGLFILVFGAWHLPRLYESALQDGRILALEDAMLLGVALVFWWPLLSPSRALPPAGPGVQALYLSFVQVALTALFSYVFMADHALYPTYQYAPRLVGELTPLEDQRLAGVILGLVSSLVLLGALGSAFFRWARHSENPAAQR